VGEDVQASMFGTSQDTQTKHSITNGSLVIKGEDNEINFKFTGTTLALIFYMNSSGFNMEITVDGTTKIVSTDSVFVNSKYSHPQLFVFNQTLSLKEHTVKIKFKPTNSASVNVRLGGAATAGTTN